MFIVLLTYKKTLTVVDQFLTAHRDFLEKGYQDNCFVASGPQNPRTGGIIISHLKSREQLEILLEQDPFKINDVADYKIMEFDPVKYHTDFANFII